MLRGRNYVEENTREICFSLLLLLLGCNVSEIFQLITRAKLRLTKRALYRTLSRVIPVRNITNLRASRERHARLRYGDMRDDTRPGKSADLRFLCSRRDGFMGVRLFAAKDSQRRECSLQG